MSGHMLHAWLVKAGLPDDVAKPFSMLHGAEFLALQMQFRDAGVGRLSKAMASVKLASHAMDHIYYDLRQPLEEGSVGKLVELTRMASHTGNAGLVGMAASTYEPYDSQLPDGFDGEAELNLRKIGDLAALHGVPFDTEGLQHSYRQTSAAIRNRAKHKAARKNFITRWVG